MPWGSGEEFLPGCRVGRRIPCGTRRATCDDKMKKPKRNEEEKEDEEEEEREEEEE